MPLAGAATSATEKPTARQLGMRWLLGQAIRISAFRPQGSIEKLPNTLSDKSAGVFKSEMACINQVQLCVREISLVGLGSLDGEKWVVLPPENQHPWLPAAEVFMPTVIEYDIRLIVMQKIELNCGIAR